MLTSCLRGQDGPLERVMRWREVLLVVDSEVELLTAVRRAFWVDAPFLHFDIRPGDFCVKCQLPHFSTLGKQHEACREEELYLTERRL